MASWTVRDFGEVNRYRKKERSFESRLKIPHAELKARALTPIRRHLVVTYARRASWARRATRTTTATAAPARTGCARSRHAAMVYQTTERPGSTAVVAANARHVPTARDVRSQRTASHRSVGMANAKSRRAPMGSKTPTRRISIAAAGAPLVPNPKGPLPTCGRRRRLRRNGQGTRRQDHARDAGARRGARLRGRDAQAPPLRVGPGQAQ
jgi:hypothetical protein